MLDVQLRQRNLKALRILTDIPLAPLTRYSSSSSSSSSPIQSATPETIPSPVDHCFFFHVVCIHDFESPDPDHLSFHKDEVLAIVKQEHSGWWAAMRPDGVKVGWIPSSFVQPLDRSRIVQSDEDQWLYESSPDHPLSAVHDSWVPAWEDCKFQLVTPTDLVPYHFFDEKLRDYNDESFTNLSSAEQFSDMSDIRVPLTPESAPPHCPQRSFLPEFGISQLTRPASPAFLHTALGRRSRPCNVPSPFLTPSVSPGESPPEHTSGSEESLMVHELAATSQDAFHLACHDLRMSNIKSLELTNWDPRCLAEQLCILVHALYATIYKNNCLDWMAGRRSTEMTALRRFFDTHEHIASWAQLSVLSDVDTTRRADVLNFWIPVAEACPTLGNFDSLCAIILALSESAALSLLGPALARCVHQRTFVTPRYAVDASNKFYCLEDAMDAAEGPSVPFVHRCLNRIKELRTDRSTTSFFAADTDPTTATYYAISPHIIIVKSKGPYRDLSTVNSESFGRLTSVVDKGVGRSIPQARGTGNR